MRGWILFLLFFTVLLEGKSTPPQPPVAVSYDLGGGRFGDKLLCYLHAKWISYKYEIPMLYRPFKYSEHLYMHNKEKKYSELAIKKFSRVITPSPGSDINYNDRSTSTLFMIPYFPENHWEHDPDHPWYYFKVDWEDPGFLEEIKRMLRPLSLKPKIKIPKKRLSVAIHARLGGGFDTWHAVKHAPLKLPPFSYYIDQLDTLCSLFPNEPLYVYLFTDDPSPLHYVEQLKSRFKGKDILFDCRAKGNAHNLNVIQDFIEMGRFECLIRPDSNYSILVEKITPFKVIISPVHFTWLTETEGFVDQVNIINRRK